MLCYFIIKNYIKQIDHLDMNQHYFIHGNVNKNNGFQWSDIKDECINFYYNKSNHRKLDNYYDSIKILSVHNLNKY